MRGNPSTLLLHQPLPSSGSDPTAASGQPHPTTWPCSCGAVGDIPAHGEPSAAVGADAVPTKSPVLQAQQEGGDLPS